MANVIAVIVLILIVALAVWQSIKHFKGEGGCCGGGGSIKPEKKKLDKVVHTYVLKIEGMHCSNCSDNVMRAVNNIDGASANVSLKKKQAIVSTDRDIDMEIVRSAIEQRGYTVTECTESV